MASTKVSLRLFRQSWSCLNNSMKNITSKTTNLQRRLYSRVEQTATNNSYGSSTKTAEEVAKLSRREFRKFTSRIYRKNRMDPELESRARKGNLIINLDDVNKVWMSRQGFGHIQKLAKHNLIFEHVFGGLEFTPTKSLEVNYNSQDGCPVYWGNFKTPSETLSAPHIHYEGTSDLWSLVLVNPDGNIWQDDAELLHWLVINIPGDDISQGTEVATYLPPVPPKGTGYHRYVFCLLQQKGPLDIEQITPHSTSVSSQRGFKMVEMLESHKDLRPAGLSFFQATWDETVPKTYQNLLGLQEPVYKPKGFITPTGQRNQAAREKFNRKYTNM